MNILPHASKLAVKSSQAFFLLFLATLLPSTTTVAQQTSVTDGKTPSGLTPGAPAGSYALSGFENVNLFNGNLSFRLPLLSIGGRGSAGHPVTLPIEQKWIVKKGQVDESGYTETALSPNPNWWQGLKPGYGPGVMHGRRAGYGQYPDGTYCGATPNVFAQTITRLTFTASDGTEYELRDQLTDGTPAQVAAVACSDMGATRGTVFVTSDGSAATFVSDAPVSDYKRLDLNQSHRLFYPSGYFLLKDGTRYRIDGGKVSWMRDRNGNTVSFAYAATGGRLSSIIDALNRQTTITYADSTRAYDELTFAGVGGAPRTVRVWYESLGSRLRTTQSTDATTPQTYYQLFALNSASSTTTYNAGRVSKVELPDGRHYEFRYNVYGELARVVLPTGGAFEYDWAGEAHAADELIFRYVTERRVYPNGTNANYENRTTYSRDGYVDTYNAQGTLLSRSRHYFYGNPYDSMLEDPARPSSISFSRWREGREYRTETFDIVNGTAVLKQIVEHTWQQPAASSTWPLAQAETSEDAKPNDPHITETRTTLADTNQVSKQTFAYDRYGNLTDTYEYDYGTGAPPAHPVKHSNTTYLANANGLDYESANPSATSTHIRSLPQHQRVYAVHPATGAETQVAHTETVYDETPLSPWYGTVSGWCGDAALAGCHPGTGRGNATRVRKWLDVPAPAIYVETRVEYDRVGNIVKTVDARGKISYISFTDSFSDGNNSRHTYAFPTSTTSPVPDPSGTTAANTPLVNASVYDFSTGRLTATTDSNNHTTILEYDPSDKLDRLKAVRRPAGGGRTDYEYGDAVGNLYLRTLTDLDASRRTESYQRFDRLGRSVRAATYDGTMPNPWSIVDTEFDGMGRDWKVSNAYRAASRDAATPVSAVWTTQQFDGLNRIKAVTTPDGARVVTNYLGNKTMVTDPTGRSRRSEADALGRLKQVVEYNRIFINPVAVEAPDANDYLTNYEFDVSGNLRQVEQGGQLRFFAYDSLSRLIRVKHPEQGSLTPDAEFAALTANGNSQWSMAYLYDANGNLAKRKDARNRTTTYSYDALNRSTAVRYSDGTPETNRNYDGAINGRGRFWRSYVWGAGVNEHAVVESYDEAGRPLVRRQQFYSNNVWSAAYYTSRTYDLAGHVRTQQYASGHIVNYEYDDAGRLSDFNGQLGDGVSRPYATDVAYDEASRMRQERLGTDTPLYHKLHYNVRGQLYDVRLSTQSMQTSEWDWNRGAVVAWYSNAHGAHGQSGSDNNGNVVKMHSSIPLNEQQSNYAYYETRYDYDSLNRLTSVAEHAGTPAGLGAQSYAQVYDYDRWGNRRLNQTGTWEGSPSNLPTATIPETQFTVETTTNRLGVPAGQSGTISYDNAGNTIVDTYSASAVMRNYDGENRLTKATTTGNVVAGEYAYDADGHRVRRRVGGQEVWQVYGMDGELLAEYAAQSPPSAPQKEYGYRNGQVLLTASGSSRINVALSSNGATASASSSHSSNFPVSAVNNGDRKGTGWGAGGGWNDATINSFPDWVEVNFNASKTIDEIDVFTLQDNYSNPVEPTETMTWTQYGVSVFDVQYWNGTSWQTVPGGSIAGNTKIWRKLTFSPITTSKVRVSIHNAAASYSRIVEVEAYTAATTGGVDMQWLVNDQVGTPRIIADKSGSLAGIKRHDFLPFGEELHVGVGGRTAAQGYGHTADARQRFTSKERDAETGLDYFGARYYGSSIGRFTSVDPALIDAKRVIDPQYINAYVYARNSPLRYVDPDGADPKEAKTVVVVFGGGAWYLPGQSGSSGSGSTGSWGRVSAGCSTEGLGESALDADAPHIAQKIKNDFPNVEVIIAGPDAKDEVFQYLAGSNPDNILISGYSRGGIMAIDLANDLADNGQVVSQLTTVDPLTKPNFESDRTVNNTPRIMDAVNFTNTPHVTSVKGATNIVVTNAFRAPHSRTPVNHNNLDDITAPRVVNRLHNKLKEIEKTFRL